MQYSDQSCSQIFSEAKNSPQNKSHIDSLSLFTLPVLRESFSGAMEGSSSHPSDSNQTASGASGFLANLPSRGLFSSTVISSNPVISSSLYFNSFINPHFCLLIFLYFCFVAEKMCKKKSQIEFIMLKFILNRAQIKCWVQF